MKKNRALVLKSPKTIILEEMSIPRAIDDEILIRVRYVALCGSDIKLYQGAYSGPHKYPVVIGHEWVGEIEQLGPGVKGDWKIGDVVTGDCSIYCNECYFCGIDKNQCSSVMKRGITLDGACSQYLISKETYIYRCNSLPDISAYALAEPLAVAGQAISRIPSAALKQIKKALIIGAGGIGMMTMFILREFGIPEIVVTDLEKEKLDRIDSLRYPNIRTVVDGMQGKSDILGAEFDLVVEAAGNGSCLKKAIEVIGSCGKIVCIGHQKNVELNCGDIIKKSLSIFGSIGGTGSFQQAIDIIEKNYDSISKMITCVVPMEKAGEYLEQSGDKSPDIKVLIDLS